MTKLNGVKVVAKPPKKLYEDADTHSKSSDVTMYNLFEQDYEVLQANSLDRYFENEYDFKRKQAEAEAQAQANEAQETGDETCNEQKEDGTKQPQLKLPRAWASGLSSMNIPKP
ncbi:hypothetical protein [Halobacillus sp. Marseille-Q1614]|uniref:hypothetical protein n=1 Tax=Halobacillus sp. Marseille-Q1614 TaxID=2709134 RepID=UPI00156FB496|nr:hypothetical protein [Halobacillus sp. Marseille-Q1614]